MGVQLPTIFFHLPLNNKLQKIDLDNVSDDNVKVARLEFEQPWNRSNEIRTAMAVGVSLLLMLVALRQ